MNYLGLFYLFAFILLFFWASKLDTGKYKVFIYCFVATFVGPIYSSDTDDGKIEIWFPVGFTVAVLYLLGNERGESVKWKAAFLGVIIGIIQAVKQNWSIL